MARRPSQRLSADLRRSRPGTRQPRVRVLIVTEGTRTEIQYFDGLVRHLRATATTVSQTANADVTGVGPGPARALETARRLRKQASRDGKPYDEVWLVFDVDEHVGIPETIAAAKRESINVAVANPCFELWLLAHFADIRAEIDRGALADRLSSQGISSKNLPAKFDFALYVKAVDRVHTNLDGDRIPINPGETVSPLVKLLRPQSPAEG